MWKAEFQSQNPVNKSRKLELGAHRASDFGAAIMLESRSRGATTASFSVNRELSVCVYGVQGYFALRELIDGRLSKATSFYLKET